MMEVSENGSAYQALAHFFRANYFYQLTMDFGAIPYSDALKGETGAVYQLNMTVRRKYWKVFSTNWQKRTTC